MLAIKAHFDGKVIVPEEAVTLPINQALILHARLAEPLRRPEGMSALEWITEHAIDDDSLPRDFSNQHDHYLYGAPKNKPAQVESRMNPPNIEKSPPSWTRFTGAAVLTVGGIVFVFTVLVDVRALTLAAVCLLGGMILRSLSRIEEALEDRSQSSPKG